MSLTIKTTTEYRRHFLIRASRDVTVVANSHQIFLRCTVDCSHKFSPSFFHPHYQKHYCSHCSLRISPTVRHPRYRRHYCSHCGLPLPSGTSSAVRWRLHPGHPTTRTWAQQHPYPASTSAEVPQVSS